MFTVSSSCVFHSIPLTGLYCKELQAILVYCLGSVLQCLILLIFSLLGPLTLQFCCSIGIMSSYWTDEKLALRIQGVASWWALNIRGMSFSRFLFHYRHVCNSRPRFRVCVSVPPSLSAIHPSKCPLRLGVLMSNFHIEEKLQGNVFCISSTSSLVTRRLLP